MQKFILSLSILFVSLAINAQDMIVTKQQDTIFCKIYKIYETKIIYEEKDGKEIIGKMINIEGVKFYKKKAKAGYNLSNVRVGFNGGGMSSLANSTYQINNLIWQGVPKKDASRFVNDMFFITNFGAGINYFSKQTVGIGLKYHFMFSHAKADFIMSSYNGIAHSVLIDDRSYFNYIAPSIAFQKWLGEKQKTRFTAEIALGYVNYREETRQKEMQIPRNSLVTGDFCGGNFEIGLEYYLKKNLSIGANLGTLLMIGTIESKNSNYYYDDDDYYRSKRDTGFIPTLTYSLSVRYHFNYKNKNK